MGTKQALLTTPVLPWFLVPGLLLYALSIWGVLVLDSSNQSYTRLMLEQDAALLASSVARIFGPGPGADMEASLALNPGSRLPMHQGARELPETGRGWYNERFQDFRNRSSQILAESWQKGLRGMALFAPRTGFLWQTSRYQSTLMPLLEQPGRFEVLPYGDRIFHANDHGTMIYLKPLMNAPMRRPGPGDANLRGIHLVLVYDGGDIAFEGFVRRLILWSFALMVWLALASMLYLLRRNQRLQEDLGHREVLAGAGAAARTLAHEIRTPLSIISMQNGLLKKNLGHEHHKALERIDTQIQRMEGLTRDMRSLLRPGAYLETRDSEDAHRLHCNLAVFFGEFPGPDLWPRLQLQGGPALAAGISGNDLQSIMSNLLQNAHDADPQSPVWISWHHSKPQRVSIQVSDAAGGIPLHLRHRLFDPFFTTRTTGMGLGLKHARLLARKAGGDLVYRHLSKKPPLRMQAGSCFTLELPLAIPEVPESATAKDPT